MLKLLYNVQNLFISSIFITTFLPARLCFFCPTESINDPSLFSGHCLNCVALTYLHWVINNTKVHSKILLLHGTCRLIGRNQCKSLWEGRVGVSGGEVGLTSLNVLCHILISILYNFMLKIINDGNYLHSCLP